MIDCHCHLQDSAFGESIDSIIRQGIDLGIEKWVVNGTKESDWPNVAKLAQAYPDYIQPSFGYHPWYVKERSNRWLKTLSGYLEQFPTANVGEIGLDRWIKDHDIKDQLEVFIHQWQLADQFDRPITVHCLRAWGVLVDCLPQLKPKPYLLHSYSGSKELIPTFSEHGAYFSISGYFFEPKKRNKLLVFDAVPKNRLLLETDAPAMPLPESLCKFGGREVNHPCNLSVIYRRYSEFADQSVDKTLDQVKQNHTVWQR